jgi:hypothetical protein
MSEITEPSRLRRLWLVVVVLVIAGIVVGLLLAVRQARLSANRVANYGRLYYIGTALLEYAQSKGTLPPLSLRDEKGKPSLSWRALVLPYFGTEAFQAIDLSQPWSSDENRKAVEKIPLWEWNSYGVQDQPPAHTHIFALLGDNSLWDSATGLPRGTIAKNPNAILLVLVPESQIEPLQPGDITEEEVRNRIEQGQEILFINASRQYGIVEITNGKLAFPTWEEIEKRSGKRN